MQRSENVEKHLSCTALNTVASLRGDTDADLTGKLCIVISRYNSKFTTQLLEGALGCLKESNFPGDRIMVVEVPGAFEIPVVLDTLARKNVFSVFIALGVVIRGETPHADLINRQVTQSLSQTACRYSVPVVDGIIPADTVEQARERCMPGKEGRGWYVALTALEMMDLMTKVKRSF